MPAHRTRRLVVCARCGAEFWPKPSMGQRFCSVACARVNPRGTLEDRFWSRVTKAGPDDCWLWTGGQRHKAGYGGFWDGQRWTHSHRMAHRLVNGPIPTGLVVRHRCDNPPCCNPAHLLLGTKRENSADMKERGRAGRGPGPARQPRGERHGHAKLTESDVRAMRSRYAAGGVSMADIAREFGVAGATAREVIRGLIWAHVE